MMEKKRPRVILLEGNDAILQSANAVLSQQGWDVTCERVSKQALKTLKESKNGIFALFISNYKLPKMEGDTILSHVKKISPLTRRMLMVSADEPDILINAINKAEINACITAPFKEEDLIHQTRNCFRQFRRKIKRQRLKRVTEHQNKQMLNIARKLKKKDSSYQKSIENKKNRQLELKSKIRALKIEKSRNAQISVSSFIDHREISPTQEPMVEAFNGLCRAVKSVFDDYCSHHHLSLPELNMDRIFSNEESQTDDDISSEDKEPAEGSPENLQEESESDKKAPDDDCARIDPEVMENIIKYALAKGIDVPIKEPSVPPEDADASLDDQGNPLDKYLALRFSERQTKAFISQKKAYEPSKAPDVNDVLGWLSEKMISHGITDDDAITAWLQKSNEEEIVIAQGEEPVFGRPGVVTYHFESDFTNPGKINEDGSIDFRDRGDIPYVTTGTLLAEKTPAKQGHAGISVSNIPIPVDEVPDPVMTAGTCVTISEDGLTIHAQADGQPHVDALGAVSVSPELVIPGDVDFETGNVDFKGNVTVKGMVKEGFTVKCINLTVQEIDGAIIDLSGDLHVTDGINDASISVQGNIYAKFINNSSILGFGDVVVSKEIIDSRVLISGVCQNATGHIISSEISAKLGIEAGNIGTSASKPSRLCAGVNQHFETVMSRIDESLESSVNKANLLKDDIKKLEDEDQLLYEQISQKAHIQDRSQLEIKKLKKALPGIEASKNMVKLTQTHDEIKNFVKKAKQAEQELNLIFENQDSIASRIGQIKSHLETLEQKNKKYVLEKKALIDFSHKQRPLTKVTIANTVTQDTVIKGPHSSMTLKEDRSRCQMLEMEHKEDGLQIFEMIAADLA